MKGNLESEIEKLKIIEEFTEKEPEKTKEELAEIKKQEMKQAQE
jgi:hypothetical protein